MRICINSNRQLTIKSTCDLVLIERNLLKLVDQLYSILNPLEISSGCRLTEYGAQIGDAIRFPAILG